MQIGKRIEILRKRLGLTQERFAQALGYTAMRISRYEKGEAEPTENDLLKICSRYHVHIEWLCGIDESAIFEDGIILQNDRESIANRLKNIRKERNLTQKELANRIHIQQGTISKIETQQVDLSEDVAERIANGLDVGKKWLMYGDDKYRHYPVSQEMIDWLWEHPEVRKDIVGQMQDK